MVGVSEYFLTHSIGTLEIKKKAMPRRVKKGRTFESEVVGENAEKQETHPTFEILFIIALENCV